MTILSTMLAATAVLMMAPGFFLYRALIDRLRSRHARVWNDVGRPGLLFYGSLEGQRRFSRFVRHRRYETLDDPRLNRIAGVYRIYVRAYTVTFAAAALTLGLAGLGVGVV